MATVGTPRLTVGLDVRVGLVLVGLHPRLLLRVQPPLHPLPMSQPMELAGPRTTVPYVVITQRDLVARPMDTVGIRLPIAAQDVKVDHAFHPPVPPVLPQLLHHLRRYQSQKMAHAVHKTTTLFAETGHREVVAQSMGTVGTLQLTAALAVRLDRVVLRVLQARALLPV